MYKRAAKQILATQPGLKAALWPLHYGHLTGRGIRRAWTMCGADQHRLDSHTTDKTKVTCQRCLHLLRQQEEEK